MPTAPGSTSVPTAPPVTRPPRPDPTPPGQTAEACDGSLQAGYNSPCGPSLGIPIWSDMVGWDNSEQADTITLFDLDGDGKDELIGQEHHGLVVYSWSNEWGQWVPASDPSLPAPFPVGSMFPGSLRIGLLGAGQAGAVALANDASGLETWSWSPGTGEPGTGSWHQEATGGPFSAGDPSGAWYQPGYTSTIQFVPGGLDGAGYGLAGRGFNGVQFCSWDGGAKTWSCRQVTSAFNDDVMYAEVDGQYQLAPYYYDTVQFGDIYGGPEVELFGRDSAGGGVLKVYTWDSASLTFQELVPSGNWPFWSPDGQWDDVSYSSTIQPVQLVAAGDPLQVIGRGSSGLEWFHITDNDCGDLPAPCWLSLTNPGTQIYADAAGYGEPQYYETIRFHDVDGDGIDETLARRADDDQGTLVTWKLNPSAGWQQLDASIELWAGPADDPLWSDPSYYRTLRTGVVTDDHRATLVARGKYGVRNWMYWEDSGWDRPYPYGFEPFTDPQQQAAFALLNNYLDIAAGGTMRDSYSSSNLQPLRNYLSCLEAAAAVPDPPTASCPTLDSTVPIDPSGVTPEAWHAMVSAMIEEGSLALAANGHFTESLLDITNELYVLDEETFSDIRNELFPSGPPSKDSSVVADIFSFVIAGAEAIAAVEAGPAGLVVNTGALLLGAVMGGIPSLQSPNSANTFDTTVEEVATHIDDVAAAALTSNDNLLAYVVQDRGLLYLFGTLVDDGIWAIDATEHDAAISAGRLEMARWVYRTMLPLQWSVVQCAVPADPSNPGSNWPCPELDQYTIELYTAYDRIMGKDLTWYAFLSDDGGAELPPKISDDDPTFVKVFSPVEFSTPDNPLPCQFPWSFSGCNAGADIYAALQGISGWDLPCTLSDHSYSIGCYADVPSGS